MALLAGCGGSPSARQQVAASCKRQRAAVSAIGPIRSLADAKRGLRRTIDLERRGVDDLRGARSVAGVPALVRRYESALADTRRFLASLERVDPTQSMAPLQIGPSGARRAAVVASQLVSATCRL